MGGVQHLGPPSPCLRMPSCPHPVHACSQFEENRSIQFCQPPPPYRCGPRFRPPQTLFTAACLVPNHMQRTATGTHTRAHTHIEALPTQSAYPSLHPPLPQGGVHRPWETAGRIVVFLCRASLRILQGSRSSLHCRTCSPCLGCRAADGMSGPARRGKPLSRLLSVHVIQPPAAADHQRFCHRDQAQDAEVLVTCLVGPSALRVRTS